MLSSQIELGRPTLLTVSVTTTTAQKDLRAVVAVVSARTAVIKTGIIVVDAVAGKGPRGGRTPSFLAGLVSIAVVVVVLVVAGRVVGGKFACRMVSLRRRRRFHGVMMMILALLVTPSSSSLRGAKKNHYWYPRVEVGVIAKSTTRFQLLDGGSTGSRAPTKEKSWPPILSVRAVITLSVMAVRGKALIH